VLKLVENSGSPTKVVTQLSFVQQYRYVKSVYTDLNALNGVLTTSDTGSGADLPQCRERRFVENVT